MLCLVCLPHSYTGRGPAESCVRAIAEFARNGLEVHLHVPRARKAVPPGITVVESLGPLARRLPWKLVRKLGIARLRRQFARAIDAAPPGSIAYFWPNVSPALVERAKARGLITVREMINSPVGHAKPILDAAYRAAGFAPDHPITDAVVARENAELVLHDHVFASNPEVEKALIALEIPRERILPTTFGWVGSRFPPVAAPPLRDHPFRFCYAGTLNVRKGVPELIEAWRTAGIAGELWLAGAVDPLLERLVADALAEVPGLRHFGHVEDIASFYRQCDAFIFPTHEEGGPQVTYEAAACGLPVITTPMGAARLVEDGVNGLIVPPGDAAALARAMTRLAADRQACAAMGEKAAAGAARFEYGVVGSQRAQLLLGLSR